MRDLTLAAIVDRNGTLIAKRQDGTEVPLGGGVAFKWSGISGYAGEGSTPQAWLADRGFDGNGGTVEHLSTRVDYVVPEDTTFTKFVTLIDNTTPVPAGTTVTIALMKAGSVVFSTTYAAGESLVKTDTDSQEFAAEYGDRLAVRVTATGTVITSPLFISATLK